MMKTSPLTYDGGNMMSDAVGRAGTTPSEMRSIAPRLRDAKSHVLRLKEADEQGWMSLHDDRRALRGIEATIREKRQFQTCLVLGIGGSDLSARMLRDALSPLKKHLVFAGANTDPDELHDIVSALDLRSTCVNIISKSGDTLEPMASFFYVMSLFEKKVGKNAARHHVVATTDPEGGSLRELAEKNGWTTLPIPKNVGGRFSGLTAVGLFPLGFAGADIRALLRGAGDVVARFVREPAEKNGVCAFAALQYLAYAKRQQRIQVLMPYASRLREFGFWYRQLWAESLGKKEDRMKKNVYVGPTPIAALGATDQHSQIQLYNEGPNDKTVTFVEVGRFNNKLTVPKSLSAVKNLAYAANVPFDAILRAECEATRRSLTKSKRSNGTVRLPEISEYSMGQLMMFFQLAVAVSGELYNVDAYNQPGVEAGKKAMRDILTSKS